MPYIANLDPDNKPIVEPDKLAELQHKRAAFAASLARSSLGCAYVPPEDAGFVDRTPDEVRTAQEALWGGAGR